MRSKTRYLRRVGFVALVLALLAAAYALAPGSGDVQAAPTGAPVPSTATPAVNTAFTVTASWMDDQGAGSAVLMATEIGGIGSMGSCSVTTNSDGQTATVAAGNPTDTCTVTTDLDTVVEATSMSITYTCSSAGQISFTLTEGGSVSAPAVVTCGGGTIGGQITVTFSQQASCGPVQVSAYVTTTGGAVAPDGTSVTFSSSQGVLSPTQAVTTSGTATSWFTPTAGFNSATVTASALGATGQAVLQAVCYNYNPYQYNTGYYNPGYYNPGQYLPQQTAPQPQVQTATQTQPQQVYSPPAASPPPPIYSSILPPNTGDAGLKTAD
jgi:hypothetical protein